MNLSQRQVKTLLRCLTYGVNAVSSIEIKNGVAKKIKNDVDAIRKMVSSYEFR